MLELKIKIGKDDDYHKFDKLHQLNLINSSKEDNIKRNRDLIFTNMERLLPEIQKEKKIIEKLRDKGVEAILKSEDKDQILINLLVKLIIDGHNDAATLIIKNIKDVNKFNPFWRFVRL